MPSGCPCSLPPTLVACATIFQLRSRSPWRLSIWTAFAKKKLEEIKALVLRANGRLQEVEDIFEQSRAAIQSRSSSPRIHNPAVQQRLQGIDAAMTRRRSPFAERRRHQAATLDLPLFPTTS